ncbi:MAG: 1-deoxy-D-xylulose-5-phosphate reductoisomerase [Spirochaetales bacterium]|nr:1-deoxy-D-xylulose-5-phosphate reductoisomerase [Spirochaetales bacterium]
MKRILVLGCTGSIGTSTLNIVRNMGEDFCICGLQAHSNEEKLNSYAKEFSNGKTIPALLTKDDSSENAFMALIEKSKPDIVVNGIAGAAGLIPSKCVLESGINLALANKETIVMAGNLIKETAEKNNAKILPVDSEHSAIFCLSEKIGKENISKIIITASGGPFRTLPKEELNNVTVQMALKHPTWNMGKKITIDSATLANKGLEVIEAARLFNASADKIQVVIHPQSLIHSLVQTNDGVMYAQISEPDMKHPILTALTWPDNKTSYLEPFNLFDKTMNFYQPRINDFPMLGYAFECVKLGGSYSIAFNAANEIAVSAFLEEKISFNSISKIVRTVLDKSWSFEPKDYNEVFEADQNARRYAMELL